MQRAPLVTPPPAGKVRERDRSRKSRYVKPSDKEPEAQKTMDASRPSVTPGWARRYRRYRTSVLK